MERSLWYDVSGEYARLIGQISAVNLVAGGGLRTRWVNNLYALWAQVGAPGEVSDARVQGLLNLLSDIEEKIWAERDRAQTEWAWLRTAAESEIAQSSGEEDDYCLSLTSIWRWVPASTAR